MTIYVVIPVKRLSSIKSRLSPLLPARKRVNFGLLMLADVIEAVRSSPKVSKVLVVSPDLKVLEFSRKQGAEPLKEKSAQGVNAAVSRAVTLCMEENASSVLVFPSDIPLLSASDVERILRMQTVEPCVVISPSLKRDGTNSLLLHPPNVMATCYEDDSFNNHLKRARQLGLTLKVYLSRRVMLDIDTEEDLKLLLRTKVNTRATKYLSSVLLKNNASNN